MNQQPVKTGYTGARALSILVKKLKLIICLSLIAAILVSACVVVLDYTNKPYGNTVSLYISMEDVSGKLLPFLTSEVFAEQLLLDEYGLPAEYATDPQYKDAYEAAKAAAIAHDEARTELSDLSKALSRITVSLATPKDPVTGETLSSMEDIEATYNRLRTAYSSLYELLNVYMSVSAEEMVTEEHKQQILSLETQLAAARLERDAFKDSAYVPATIEIQKLQDKVNVCANLVKDTRKDAEELKEALLQEWRRNDDVKEKVSIITKSLSFSYEIPGNEDSIIKNDTANTTVQESEEMFSFLKVYVSVEGDREFAEFIIEKLKTVLPVYAEKSIERFTGASSVSCTVTSPFSEAVALDSESLIMSVAVDAIIAFVLVAALVYGILIAKDWMIVFKSEETKTSEKKADK